MDNNQKGIMVLFLYPTPKSLKLPSGLNKNKGLIKNIALKIIINNAIEKKVKFCRIKKILIIIL
jgi:hypothetical protein